MSGNQSGVRSRDPAPKGRAPSCTWSWDSEEEGGRNLSLLSWAISLSLSLSLCLSVSLCLSLSPPVSLFLSSLRGGVLPCVLHCRCYLNNGQKWRRLCGLDGMPVSTLISSHRRSAEGLGQSVVIVTEGTSENFNHRGPMSAHEMLLHYQCNIFPQENLK